MTDTDTEEEINLENVISRYCEGVDLDLKARLDTWQPDFTHIQVHEVIGAMLGRQATLSKEIASAPSIWNEHSAPILLRAMADVHINVAWLLLDSEKRCLKFISFGLGQAKLQLEHRKAEIGDRAPTPEELTILGALEGWIEGQRACFLQDVDLGKWAGLSVRQMAEEAACLDFYNFVYTPFSACAHSMWHHIARYNLVACDNPLHRYHRRPISSALQPDLNYLLLAAKYWVKTLAAFDRQFGITVAGPSARDKLHAALTKNGAPMIEPN